MPSSQKFPSGLNNWQPNDVPKRMDFVGDNQILDNFIENLPASVPPTRKINNKPLSADITLSYTDVQAEPSRLTYTAVSVLASQWQVDSTFAGYPFRVNIPLVNVTATMIPQVVFGPTEATSGNFAPVANAYSGGVIIYAKQSPTENIIIPTIILWR